MRRKHKPEGRPVPRPHRRAYKWQSELHAYEELVVLRCMITANKEVSHFDLLKEYPDRFQRPYLLKTFKRLAAQHRIVASGYTFTFRGRGSRLVHKIAFAPVYGPHLAKTHFQARYSPYAAQRGSSRTPRLKATS